MKGVAVIPGKENSVHLVDAEKPEIDADEVLVKVLEVGIDGTDSEINQGLYGEPPQNFNFLIIGHESFGVVDEVGENIKGIKKGDYVVATVRRPDSCINCKSGEYDMCLTGNYVERGIRGMHGFLTEYYKEKEEYLVKVPEELKSVGVLLEPMSIVEKAVSQTYRMQERMVWQPKTAVVMGTGSIGLLAMMLLKLKGLDVVAVDRTEHHEIKAPVFEKLGVQHFSSKSVAVRELPEKIKKNIDLVIEATGSSSVAMDAMHIIGSNGVLCLTSVTGGKNVVELCADKLNLDLVLGNKAIFGTVNANRKYFEDGIKDMTAIEKQYPGLLQKLITARLPLSSFKKALELMSQKPNIKVVVEVGRQ